MNLKHFILLFTLTFLALSVDDGDWVDPFQLPIPFRVNPFFAGYLTISAKKSLYYVYTPS
jgi:hypothetical protein